MTEVTPNTPQCVVLMYLDIAAACRLNDALKSDSTSVLRPMFINVVGWVREQSRTAFGGIVAANWADFCKDHGIRMDHPDVLDAHDLLSGRLDWPTRTEDPEP